MWENADRFGAALVFAEHRYYGKSRLFSDDSCDMSLLTTEQALADYAVVVDTFKKELNATAVIGFGGSYGGMLATSFRFHYSHMVDGVIAASAPVLAYQGLEPPYDSNAFARVVTRDAGPKCAAAVKAGLESIDAHGKSKDGRQILTNEFQLCHGLESEDDALSLLEWTSSFWDYLAMGDYPYPSKYVQPEGGILPAYPMKAACQIVLQTTGDLLKGLAQAANLFYNATANKKCLFNGGEEQYSFSFIKKQSPSNMLLLPNRKRRRIQNTISRSTSSRPCAGDWDWQWCTEHSMPFTSGTDKDMFFPPTGPFDPVQTAKMCKDNWHVEPNPFWARLTYGGLLGLQRGLTNVVFSNGMLDPWSAGGVLDGKDFDESVVIVLIPHGAHHLDLMFSHEDDPIDVKVARWIEVSQIEKWIAEAQKKHRTKYQDRLNVHDHVVVTNF